MNLLKYNINKNIIILTLLMNTISAAENPVSLTEPRIQAVANPPNSLSDEERIKAEEYVRSHGLIDSAFSFLPDEENPPSNTLKAEEACGKIEKPSIDLSYDDIRKLKEAERTIKKPFDKHLKRVNLSCDVSKEIQNEMSNDLRKPESDTRKEPETQSGKTETDSEEETDSREELHEEDTKNMDNLSGSDLETHLRNRKEKTQKTEETAEEEDLESENMTPMHGIFVVLILVTLILIHFL